MNFTKMQGCGNDYIFIDATKENFSNRSNIAKRLSDRHFGVGSDGAVFIEKSGVADFKMDFYNNDGSSASMCGTAVRCLSRFVYDRGLTDKIFLTVETGAGIKEVSIELCGRKFKEATVLMGKPSFDAEKIPISIPCERLFEYPIFDNGKIRYIYAVSMGNPHAVIFSSDVENANLDEIGRALSQNPIFPEGVNVEVISVCDNVINMRVLERGSGETLSCGTGACAAAVIATETGRAGERVTVNTRGGRLQVYYDTKSSDVYLKGEANFVFEGSIEI